MTGLWAFEGHLPYQKYQGPPIVVRFVLMTIFEHILIVQFSVQCLSWWLAGLKTWKHISCSYHRRFGIKTNTCGIETTQSLLHKTAFCPYFGWYFVHYIFLLCVVWNGTVLYQIFSYKHNIYKQTQSPNFVSRLG